MREGGMLLSYRPCKADESEANAAGKLDTRSEPRKELLTTMTRLTLECLAVVIGLFCTYFTTIQAVTTVEE
jgi:hypothetical protein